MWALVGAMFNDSGTTVDEFTQLLPLLSYMLTPMIIASICLIIYYSKKKELSKILLFLLQSIVVILWIILYVCIYMLADY